MAAGQRPAQFASTRRSRSRRSRRASDSSSCTRPCRALSRYPAIFAAGHCSASSRRPSRIPTGLFRRATPSARFRLDRQISSLRISARSFVATLTAQLLQHASARAVVPAARVLPPLARRKPADIALRPDAWPGRRPHRPRGALPQAAARPAGAGERSVGRGSSCARGTSVVWCRSNLCRSRRGRWPACCAMTSASSSSVARRSRASVAAVDRVPLSTGAPRGPHLQASRVPTAG